MIDWLIDWLPWQYLGRKTHCWKAHFFKICFFVKYFRQRLLPLVNMGLHAAIIRLSPLIHEGEQRYKPYIVGDPRMVSLLWPPLWKIPATPLFFHTGRWAYKWREGGGEGWSYNRKFMVCCLRVLNVRNYVGCCHGNDNDMEILF